MKKPLRVLVVLAIFSHARSLNLGDILGMRRRWHDASFREAEPEIVEIVRWRQPVCVVPGKGVPPCLATLQKFQTEYQRISAKGVEADDRKETARNRPAVPSPRIVDSFDSESVDDVKLDSSEESDRGFDRTVTFDPRSGTPEMETAPGSRRAKYLTMTSFGKATTIVHGAPPAIYVTKVMNSPVTATLVANNCFPDMGVPLCDSYQETITIYKDPASSSSGGTEGAPENTDRVAQTSETNADGAHENSDSADLWTDPRNPNFEADPARKESRRPTGLLGQAIRRVTGKPGVANVTRTGIVDAIADEPGIREGLSSAGDSGESSSTGNVATGVAETGTKPRVVADADKSRDIETSSSSSRPGLIGSLLEIRRPAILDDFFTSGFHIFERSTTSKPKVIDSDIEESSSVDSQPSGGLLGEGVGKGPVVQVHDFINRPGRVSAEEKPEVTPVLVVEPTRRPGLFENLWRPGSLGIFNGISTSTASKSDAPRTLLRSTVVQPVTSTIGEPPRENPESVAAKTTTLESTDISTESERNEGTIDEEAIEEIVKGLEKEEEVEAASTSVVDLNEPESGATVKILLPEVTVTVGAALVENPEAAVPLDIPGKSANSLEEIPEDTASEANAELAGPIEIVETVAAKATTLESTDISTKSERNEGTIDEEAIEEIAKGLEEEEKVEEASKSVVDLNEPESGATVKILLPEVTATVGAAIVENPEAAVPLDIPGKSANSLEEIPEDIASEANAELTGPIEIVESALRAVAEKPAVESSVDPSESSAKRGTVERAGNAIAVEEIVEGSERSTVPESEYDVEEAENSEEETAIEDDA